MTGADIIGALLRDPAEGLEPVAPSSIKAGRLPDGISLPALLVRVTSTIERQPLKRGTVVRTVDRVSVTVRANSYDEQRAVMIWVRQRCAGKTGDVGGGTRVSILTAGTGPEIDGPASSFERTQDFRVSYDV